MPRHYKKKTGKAKKKALQEHKRAIAKKKNKKKGKKKGMRC